MGVTTSRLEHFCYHNILPIIILLRSLSRPSGIRVPNFGKKKKSLYCVFFFFISSSLFVFSILSVKTVGPGPRPLDDDDADANETAVRQNTLYNISLSVAAPSLLHKGTSDFLIRSPHTLWKNDGELR